MSAQEERPALTPPLTLHDRALNLLRASPGGVPARRGYHLPAEPDPDEETPPWSEVDTLLEEALTPLPPSADALADGFERLGLGGRHKYSIARVVDRLPLSAHDEETARTLGRQLTRTGTTVPAVAAGLALLARFGEPEDVPYLSVLGLYRDLNILAVLALDTLDRRRSAVVWLAVNAGRPEQRPLAEALWRDDPHAVPTELLAFPTEHRLLTGDVARRIADASRLADLLDEHPTDTHLLARAGLLLVRMGRSSDAARDLLACDDALRLYESVATRAVGLPPTLDHAATLLSLALDLSSGSAVLLDWPPGRRAELLAILRHLLAEPRWAEVSDPDQQHRTDWLRRTLRRLPDHPVPPAGLRIEVVAADPADRQHVETRILIDGRPVVPEVFGNGAAGRPEHVLSDGQLRATEEPREVRLAMPDCSAEECCGAVYVTIRRDGPEVVWENWRYPGMLPGNRTPAPELPTHRFDAAAYDAEITRAETDDSWSWPARTMAHLIRTGLEQEPELLKRWNAKPGWISVNPSRPETVVVTIWQYRVPVENPARLRWVLPDDGTPPESQAAAALRRLTEEDPRTIVAESA
ncbi:hypothetical protein ACIBCA_00425 [Kitasatospora sp. NPDC051170]|uniref:hypothetical protein n=1 Tax=Kitasatospora sp. NPDC051170 TaxID=3364056 RepID=UPI0037A4AFFE